MHHLGAICGGVEQQATMAVLGLALIAEQRTRLLFGEREHLRRLRHRLGQFQLTRVDPRHVGMPPGPRRRSAVGWGAKRLQMDILDPRFLERGTERRLGEAGATRQRKRSDVDHPLNSGGPQRRKELGDRRAFIADGEYAHAALDSAVAPD